MGKGGLANGKGHDERGKNGDLDKQSYAEFRPGDITWIKLRGTSWWPAQIVDGNAVSDNAKPRKGKSGEVLVRLYGTYKYLHMDPVKSLLEFTNVLKRNNSTQREMFKKALDQDLSELQSGRTNTRKVKAKGNDSVHKEKPVSSKRGFEEHDDDTPKKPDGSARRLKVMQDLGLTAPSGSPFLKNGQVLSVVK
ncbi:histone-lysine N-methyltransferase ATX1-like [Chenopodium quinoa]|nr:histone-lysine N-methyltransferase ATX1-like [Chenopodium quinoa]XP_021743667.1 histone-lysine N-methyltransferase ATX1-like [Chenopodium quinoa]XP_021743668.1 histone-lysine N-methyltransferase ATX1-like [Chenopodium quinoa]